ncbi:VPS9 domain-containing protein 1 [Ambystoma mexicanum]|uniref:VPS9 domain-containing protein 1 n=1 Tax=Ambystoma mexicanum TaxID=8296 RepID=UPI0037E7B8DC
MATSGTAFGDGVLKPLQIAMKLANGAIELDASSREKDAYVEYLKSIRYISQILVEEAEAPQEHGSEVVTPDTPKMLKLLEQCLERAKSTAAKLAKTMMKPVADCGPTVTAVPASEQSSTAAALPETVLSHRRGLSDEGGKRPLFPPPEVFQMMQAAEAQCAKKELTPLEEASRQNQKLRAAYEARLARLNPKQAMQKTSLTLSLQRQMMENLVIAKAREETLQRKMEERRVRLQEEASRRFSSNVAMTPEEEEQRVFYTAVLEYEQDNEWPKNWKSRIKKHPNDLSLVAGLVFHILGFHDHPVSQLLRKLQYRIYSKLYRVISRKPSYSLMSSNRSNKSHCLEGLLQPDPVGNRLKASQSLHCIPSVQEKNRINKQVKRHSLSTMPLIEDLGVADQAAEQDIEDQALHRTEDRSQKDLESPFEDLGPLLTDGIKAPSVQSESTLQVTQESTAEEHLKTIVKDIHNAIDQLLSLILMSFDFKSDSSCKDQCLECIEEVFFPPIWPALLALYRIVYKLREGALLKSMELYQNAHPSSFGVAPKLFPEDLLLLPNSYPYQAAAEELQILTTENLPQKKLEIIVRSLRRICECAEDYCNTGERKPQQGAAAIGADDLLPILSYVVLRSHLPQLVSECLALEEFIHEGSLIGEEGYCLTSLQSALSYVESLHKNTVHQ